MTEENKLSLMSRVKIFSIHPPALRDILAQKTVIITADGHEVTSSGGIPTTAQYRGALVDISNGCVNLYFEDDSFEPIKEGKQFPFGKVIFTRKHRDGANQACEVIEMIGSKDEITEQIEKMKLPKYENWLEKHRIGCINAGLAPILGESLACKVGFEVGIGEMCKFILPILDEFQAILNNSPSSHDVKRGCEIEEIIKQMRELSENI